MSNIYAKLKEIVAVKSAVKEYAIEIKKDGVIVDGCIIFRGADLSKHLVGCTRCAIMAVTLGTEVDRRLRRLQFSDMAAALDFDAAANVYIEEVCDRLEAKIAASAFAVGFRITKRFSPGYGDFPLDSQPALLSLTNATKEAGITVSPNNLLLPQKTVTAVIGYKPIESKR